jgi:hypothetical protein
MKLLLLTGLAQAYSLCNPSNYPWKGLTVSVPLVQSITKTFLFQGQTIAIPSISGSIQIVDGCTFRLVNFTMNAPAALNLQWYALTNVNPKVRWLEGEIG